MPFVVLDEVKAQQGPGPVSQNSAGAAENTGQDFTRPENLFQLRYEYRTAPGTGSDPGTIRTVTTDMVALRSDLKIDVAPQWTLALRGDLPFVDRNPITATIRWANSSMDLADADVQAALIKTLNARWAAGAGIRLIAPTGSADLTSDKWAGASGRWRPLHAAGIKSG